MEGLKGCLFILVIFTLFVYGSNQSVGNVCSDVEEIPCDDGECILRSRWCDNFNDCYDDSDEKYCEFGVFWNRHPNDCNEKHFNCSDGRCFPASVRCDNLKDCKDSSDEQGCETSTTTAATEEPTTTGYAFQMASTASSVSENYGAHEEASRFSSSTNPWPGVHATSEPTLTDHYDVRRMHSANQNGRYSRNGRNLHQDRQDHNINYNQPHNYGRHDQHHSRNDHQNYDYGGGYDPNSRQDYGQNSNVNHGGQDHRSVASEYEPNQRHHYRPTIYPPTVGPSRYPNYETTPRYYSSPQSRDSNTQRNGLTLIAPKSVLYPPEQRTSHSDRGRKIQKPAFAPFYFQRNFTVDTQGEYSSNIRRAKDWILARRDHSYSWGGDTPRALIALSLITNTFSANVTENDLLRKSLKTHLGLKLLRNNTGIEKMSTTRLAMYIHALLATCQDPRDFWGMDLTEILHRRRNHLEAYQTFVNPLVYLSLCLTDQPISHGDMEELLGMLVPRFPGEVSKDLHILATISLSCFLQHNGDNHLRDMLRRAFDDLLTQKNSTDGSFGSIYSTALAAQAFMSSNLSANTPLRDTLRTLARSQLEDGSFGDMQATYYIVLALSGRSLLHLRNTQCDRVEADESPIPSPDCPKKKVFLSLRVGHPEIFSTAIQVTMCRGASAFDAMRIAADLDPRFKFHYKITNGQLGVHTIVNVPNDIERGLFWNLYVLSTPSNHVDTRQRYTQDIRELIPTDGAELLYWYLPIQLK